MSRRIIEQKIEEGTTSGLETVVIASFEVPANTVGSSCFNLVGENPITDEGVVISKEIAFKRSAGNASIIGTQVDLIGIEADIALILCDANFVVSSTAINVSVTGVSLVDINWVCHLKYCFN